MPRRPGDKRVPNPGGDKSGANANERRAIKKKGGSEMATQKKTAAAKSASKSATKNAAKKNTKSAAKFRPSVRVVKNGNFKVASVTTLKDGTKKVATCDGIHYIHPDGTVAADVSGSVCLVRSRDDGKWYVRFGLDGTFAHIVEMLQNEMDDERDLSGTLEDGSCCGVFYECSEGMAESEPLTDEQAAKVRAYFPTFDDVK